MPVRKEATDSIELKPRDHVLFFSKQKMLLILEGFSFNICMELFLYVPTDHSRWFGGKEPGSQLYTLAVHTSQKQFVFLLCCLIYFCLCLEVQMLKKKIDSLV